jgi:hypothetical protein
MTRREFHSRSIEGARGLVGGYRRERVRPSAGSEPVVTTLYGKPGPMG